MKKLLKAGVAAFAALTMAGSAIAADWTPPGPITLMIGFRAGGGADTQARLIAEALEAKLGWKFLPQQVTGKGGVNLLTELAKAPNDGTAIGMVVTESLGYNLATSGSKLTAEDFTGLTTTAGFQMGIVAKTDRGWKDMNDVIAAMRNGETISFGVMSPRLADLTYLLEKAQGVQFNMVNFKGGKAVLNAINAGDVDVGYVAGVQAKGVKAGELVDLASAIDKPLTLSPNAPTLQDLRVKFSAEGYFVFVGPKGMPAEAQKALGDAIASVASDPDAKVAGIINRAFGGPSIIKGAELDGVLKAAYDDAGALVAAVNE